jgi:two-component system sensor histidine kinase KdpD
MIPLRGHLGVLNPALVYLLLVVAVALLWGDGPAISAAFVSFVALDFFFIPPTHGFSVARSDHVLALFVYLGVAVLISQLVVRARERAAAAERETLRTTLLYELNAALVRDVTLDAILGTIVDRVVHVYGAQRGRILLPDDDGALTVRASFPRSTDPPDRQALAMAELAMSAGRSSGLGARGRRVLAPHAPGERPAAQLRRRADVLYVPIAVTGRQIGVLEVTGRSGGGRFDAEDERILLSFADQAALALERGRLAEEAARAAVLAKSDELKSALLAAVSHDLRTPLAVIKASVTSLLDESVAWTFEQRRQFLVAADEETDRLALMVGNLLDLSRIEAGVLRPDKEWYDIAEVVADVAERMAPHAERTQHRITTDVAPDLPLVRFDYVEIAQVLTNLTENAIKYSPAGSEVTLGARRAPAAVELWCRDRGPGISLLDRERIFEKFQRLSATRSIAGSGIGLAICKGLVEGHGGAIWVDSAPGQGSTFHFTLPLSHVERTEANT